MKWNPSTKLIALVNLLAELIYFYPKSARAFNDTKETNPYGIYAMLCEKDFLLIMLSVDSGKLILISFSFYSLVFIVK